MIRSVFAKTLWERRRGVVGWTVGMVALAALTIAFYPSIRSDTEAFQSLFEAVPEGLLSVFGIEDASSLVTATGFINSRLYTGIGPVLLAVFGISLGTAAVAGEEDRGTLDLLLAQPVTRTKLVIQKFAAMVVQLAAVATALVVTLLVSNPLVDLGLQLDGMVAANLGLMLLAMVFGSFALAAGAVSGRRGLTIGLSATVTGATFVINGLAPLVEEIEWTQRLTPFFWLQHPNPLANGFAWGWFGLMVLVSAALVGIAVVGFNRRDVGV